MNRLIILAAMAIVALAASIALALDNTALTGTWQLVEEALDKDGNPCPFVSEQIAFTADGKMISPNMPVPFRYKVNPTKAESDRVVTRAPELQGMEIMLATVGDVPGDWSKAPIAYGVQLKDNIFTMKVPGFTPARYKKQKLSESRLDFTF